jgi:hypothetical protein
VARQTSESAGVVQSTIWFSGVFWEPPYRSWPHPPTELETFAARAGVNDDELRLLLEEEIQRRRRATFMPQTLKTTRRSMRVEPPGDGSNPHG